MTDHADTIRLIDAQSDWFIREVKRCREIGMPLGCCDAWPECSHVYEWMEPDSHEGNLSANIAGGRVSAVTDHAGTIRRYELAFFIGPCSEEERDALADAIIELPEFQAVGGGGIGMTEVGDDD